MGLTTQRHTICEAALSGNELQKSLEESEQTDETIVVSNDQGEWQFQRLENIWVLRCVMLYVPIANLKELIKDL